MWFDFSTTRVLGFFHCLRYNTLQFWTRTVDRGVRRNIVLVLWATPMSGIRLVLTLCRQLFPRLLLSASRCEQVCLFWFRALQLLGAVTLCVFTYFGCLFCMFVFLICLCFGRLGTIRSTPKRKNRKKSNAKTRNQVSIVQLCCISVIRFFWLESHECLLLGVGF